jgi:hypothetical protein
MNAIERLRQWGEINKALETQDYGALAKALKIEGEMFDDLPLEELIDIMTVRLADITKQMEIKQKTFTCAMCKIELPITQAFARHGYPKSQSLCSECYIIQGRKSNE